MREKSQAIGEFLEWLRSGEADGSKLKRSVFLGVYTSETEILPFQYSVEALLARFFEIDLKKVEQERRALLEEMRCHD